MSRVKLKRPPGRPSAVTKAIENWLMDFANWLNEWQYSAGHYTARPDSSLNSYVVTINRRPNRSGAGEFTAAPWLKWAVFGRKSGKMPPATRVAGKLRWLEIEQWIKDKPISISGGISIESLAFLIARKIGEEGTNPPKLRQQNIDLVLNNFSKKHLDTLGDDLAEETANQVAKQFERIKAA